MRDFFNRESELNNIIIYRVSSHKSRLAVGKIIENEKKYIRVKSIAVEDGKFRNRNLSMIKDSAFVIVNDKNIKSLFEAVTCQE